jgi:uncharacterized protein (DUF433 family)
MLDDSLVAFTPDRAAQLTGLSRRQVDYWRKTLLLSPSVEEQVSVFRSIRLYGFSDMIALMTVAELLNRNVTLQRVRKIVSSMQDIGLERPLSEIRWGTVGPSGSKRLMVTLRLADGTVVGANDPGQSVLADVLDIDEIRTRIRKGTKRSREDVGRTVRKHNTRGSREVFAGTRVPVDTVRAYLAEGVPEDEILEAFPALERRDLASARAAG